MADKKGGSIDWNKTVFRSITTKQFVAMIIAFALGLIILCIGLGGSVIGWLLTAVILYIFPRLTKVKTRDIAAFGAVFAVVGIVVGGLSVAPEFIDANSDKTPSDHGAFSNVTYTYTDDGIYTVEFDYNTEGYEGDSIVLYTAHINQILFTYPRADSADAYVIKTIESGATAPASSNTVTVTNESGTTGHAVFTLNEKTLSTDTLWELDLIVGTCFDKDESSGTAVYTYRDSASDWAFDSSSVSTASLTGYTGADKNGPSFVGCADAMLYVMIMFFLIVGMVWLIRDRVNKTRSKMEKEGRLYPQGYGRCDNCGALILPGEIKCRKCGTYINRPESMKPKKTDFFQCSECGAEVPSDAKVCPKCGAKFDGEEQDIVKSDGSIEKVSERAVCPGCGCELPDGAEVCPKCGRKL